MRHNKKINHLGRTSSHRVAMLSNMASSLIKHKRIFTTTAKAKALRKYVEPLINRSKEDTTHSRRTVFSKLQDKGAVTELFSIISQKIGDRPGGYTRIIKTGNRLGDNAAMCFIELVDFNENMLKTTTKKSAGKTRRSRRKSPVATGQHNEDAANNKEEAVAEQTVKEVEKSPATTEKVVPAEEVKETTANEEKKVAEKAKKPAAKKEEKDKASTEEKEESKEKE